MFLLNSSCKNYMIFCCLFLSSVIILLVVNCQQGVKSNAKKIYFGLAVNCSSNLGRIIQNFTLEIKIIGLNHNSASVCIPSYYRSWLCGYRTSIISVGMGLSQHSHKLVLLNAWVIENAKTHFINSARKRVIIINVAENLEE